ncbi:RNA polymerase sigma-70 factor [mine drainage metagenome]|uniref:RNA polymerase sigma-70 factor n=1 Tax=mine drainage metagenome TaxID=410659 RepID=T1CHZ2_9ZZZZ
MGENETDRMLVERVQQGDTRAYDLLVRKYQHKIVALVSRYINDWTECEDIAQEAFIRAYRAIGSFRGESQFYTWLYKIAVNTAKNHLVSQGRRPPTDDIASRMRSTCKAPRRCVTAPRLNMSCFGKKLNKQCFPRSKRCLRICAWPLPCAKSRA